MLIKLEKAFSLIELMIVIAIIGLLSAVAGPSYKNYIIKAKIIEAVTLLNAAKTAALAQAQPLGTMQLQPFEFLGTSFNDATSVNPPNENINVFYYNRSNASEGSGMHFCASMANIGIDGQVPMGDGSWSASGTSTALCLNVWEDNGTIKVACGRWNSSGWNIPVTYLPAGCNCTQAGTAANPGC